MTKGRCCRCTILGFGSNPGAMGTLIELSAFQGQPCAGGNPGPCPSFWCPQRPGGVACCENQDRLYVPVPVSPWEGPWVSLATWAGLGDRVSWSLRAM